MNLYLFVESSRGAIFGIGTYIRELTAILAKNRINVCVIHLNTDKTQIQMDEKESIRHWYFPAPIPKKKPTNFINQDELYYRNIVYLLRLHIEAKTNLIFHLNNNQHEKLANELKKMFDCIVVTTTHYFGWSLGLFGNILHFRKIILSDETSRTDSFSKTVYESYINEKELYEKVDHVICLAEHTRQILENDYQIDPHKICVIYNGLTECSTNADKIKLRHKYHIPHIPIILFAGQIADIKGLAYALRAFRIVLTTYPNCHFIIAGNGAFDSFMKECEDIWMHITWTGLINKDKLYDLYQIADIGVMPSFHEQCSYVAIEMFMHGVPLIASTSTGLCEMVEDGVSGLNIPIIEYADKSEIDVNLFAKKILYLLQHPKEARKLGNGGRERYKRMYTSEMFGQNMLSLYQSFFN